MPDARRALLLLALAVGPAAAQDTAACARPAPRALTLTWPFLSSRDTVTLLAGELVANAAEGRGSLTIEYLTRAAPPDTARLAREAASLARAVTPYVGSTPFALLTVRACRRASAGTAGVAGTFTFTQAPSGEWQLAPP
jgi:hypothetical protein